MSYTVLDDIDVKTLQMLVANGRVSWAELAQNLGLSGPAAADRVRRLEERGIIQGYSATVNHEALGFGLTAFISVTLDKPAHREGFLSEVGRHPSIAECHHIAGDHDYLLKVRCRGTRDLERLLSEVIKGVPGVARTRTAIVLGTAKETQGVVLGDAQPEAHSE